MDNASLRLCIAAIKRLEGELSETMRDIENVQDRIKITRHILDLRAIRRGMEAELQPQEGAVAWAV